MSNLLHIYYTFVLEVRVELDVLLNNLDDTSCGVFMRYNRGFLSSGICRFVDGCFPTFRRNVSPFSSGFQSYGEWYIQLTANWPLTLHAVPDDGCRWPKHVGLTMKSFFITDKFYPIAKMYRYWIVIAWF
jgi:hypothetical protein